ncbi:hypothetical protein BCT62_24625 [Vibrio splendidus]|nr:hypothetical protein BCT62_24625 [Vibrio splendidus]
MNESISELDVVKVTSLNSSVPKAEVGDKGAVLMVFGDINSPDAYEVECVLPDGSNKWEGTFLPAQVKLVWKYSENYT